MHWFVMACAFRFDFSFSFDFRVCAPVHWLRPSVRMLVCVLMSKPFFQDVGIQYPVVPSKLSARSCAFLFQAGSGWVLIFLVRNVMVRSHCSVSQWFVTVAHSLKTFNTRPVVVVRARLDGLSVARPMCIPEFFKPAVSTCSDQACLGTCLWCVCSH